MRSDKLLLSGMALVLCGFLSLFLGYILKFRVPLPPADSYQIRKFRFEGSPTFCNVTVVPGTERKVRLSRSFILNTKIWKNDPDASCEVTIRVSAPAFDVKPEQAQIQLPDSSGKTARDFAFNLMPQQPGTQFIIIEYGEHQDQFGYSVYDYPFIPPGVTFFVPIVSTLFGSLLTIPWWIEFFGKKKKK